MKTLSNYISEKLVINKNYKKYFEKPNKEGVCLEIGYPCGDSSYPTQIKRINLTIGMYEKTFNDITLSYEESTLKRTFCDISSEGIYYSYSKPWFFIILFDGDAIDVLDNAMNNSDMEFDFKKYVPSLNHKVVNIDKVYKIGSFDSYDSTRKPYTFQRLHYMKTEIK